MGKVTSFELSYNDVLHLRGTSVREMDRLDLMKQSFEALLTELVWNAAKEETWCWLLTQLGLAIRHASRLEVDKDQDPLGAVEAAAVWFKANRREMADRMAQDEHR